MRALLQRVTCGRVEIADASVGAIEQGLLVFLGVFRNDRDEDVDWLVEKILNLRIFADDAGKMNRSVRDIGGGVLVVSQFTLTATVSRGRRPGFDGAALPADAQRLYETFVARLRGAHSPVATGVFAADMQVHLVNDGPVTLVVDSPAHARRL